ncbi:follitropin subunit beta-like [Lethenteron reissneri]|uniref:follitropin subunit beta-like n=1 Tax=Lethenteron reissneri TaxID=7753 RepID=UPI002AB706DA|nr:follitropin subunit beta-like [Lethenteron reissneri]
MERRERVRGSRPGQHGLTRSSTVTAARALMLEETVLSTSHCSVRITTVAIEDTLCGICYDVNTTICQGACVTKQNYALHGRSVQRACVYSEVRYESSQNYALNGRSVQRACVYSEVRYESSVLLRGCPARPRAATVSVPAAVSCACRRCDSRTTDCTERSVGPDFCRLRRGGG